MNKQPERFLRAAEVKIGSLVCEGYAIIEHPEWHVRLRKGHHVATIDLWGKVTWDFMDENSFIAREREKFEADAGALGFDLTRFDACLNIDTWEEYDDIETGHRWAGWLAALESMGIK